MDDVYLLILETEYNIERSSGHSIYCVAKLVEKCGNN